MTEKPRDKQCIAPQYGLCWRKYGSTMGEGLSHGLDSDEECVVNQKSVPSRGIRM